MKQYIPKSIRNAACSQTRIQPKRDCKSSIQLPTTQLSYDSAIGLHLLRNPICTQNYDDKQFCILAKVRSPFHLSIFEAIFIKTLNPILCQQKNLSTISRCSRITLFYKNNFIRTRGSFLLKI